MSGTGQPDSRAPTRLTPIVQDQPIVDVATGKPTPYFGQAFQRILSYLGQPGGGTTTGGGGGSGNGVTITEQINNLTTQIEVLKASGGGNAPQSGTIARLTLVENLVRTILRYQRTPRVATPHYVVPRAPAPPDLTPAMIIAWWGR